MIKNYELISRVKGESKFLDDLSELSNTLFAYVFTSPVAHGIIKKLELKEALESKGVFNIFTVKDIKGENQIGGIIPDEPLLAEDKVHFIGEPIAIVVGNSKYEANSWQKKYYWTLKNSLQ